MIPTRLLLLLLVVAGGLLSPTARGQAPGETPRLVLSDGQGTVAPTGPGPFNSSGVFEAPAGLAFSANLTYLASVPPNDSVLWGMFVSTQKTNFPTTQFPPPLFTQPPFVFVPPSPPNLDGLGESSHPFVVPPGLYDGTFYVQAIVLDGSSSPGLKLSNGVRVDVVPPPFDVRFSFAREAPFLTGSADIDGVGTVDLDGDTLPTLAPLGPVEAPEPVPDANTGLPAVMKFLPIVPNRPDGPVNPMSPAVTNMTAIVDGTSNLFEVADTRFFPSEGTLLVSFQNNNPWAGKLFGNSQPPKMEVVTYKGKTSTSFLNVSRRRPGSWGGNLSYNHVPGEYVVSAFNLATTAGALGRTRVSLDATNPNLPHVVVPATTFTPEGGGAPVTIDIDLYRYRNVANNREGFCVLDRVSHTWRVIPGTELDASTGLRNWDSVVCVSPDGRFFLAAERVFTGANFASDADRLWAIRLDGETWPGSGSQAWEITYQIDADPVPGQAGSDFARSRLIHMPSVAIIGSGPNDWVAYVGLAYKFAQSPNGTGVAQEGGVPVAYEAAYIRDELVVRDYIEVPMVAPGSGDTPPSMPRSRISNVFPNLGNGSALLRFDPQPAVAADHSLLVLAGGSTEEIEDVYVIRNVSINAGGFPVRTIQNISGLGSGLAGTSAIAEIRRFDLGGHGLGPKAALSPLGTRAAYVVQEANLDNRDFLHIARTNGADLAKVVPVFSNPSTLAWKLPGALATDRQINALHWLDEDRIVFLMGRGHYADPFGDTATKAPAQDVFMYTVSTDVMVNLTNTGKSPTGFENLGTLWPAGSFRSAGGRYVYYLRDNVISQGNTVMPIGTQVMNILAVDSLTGTAFDVSGDEFGALGPLRNLDIPADEALTPIECTSSMLWIEGSGSQSGTVWLTAHEAALGSSADELFFFDSDAPFIGLQLTEFSPAGSHISNVVPDPFAARVAFAATATSQALENNQHPYLADLTSFVFVRDLTPSLVSGNAKFGRLMDGSFQFLPDGAGVQDALVFSMGVDVDTGTGVARDCAAVYYPLANVTDLLLEPDPLLIGILSTFDVGPDNRIYLTSAGRSTGK